MTKTSDNIKYSPSLSIAENAKRNGVNEDAIRYYIRTRGVDRRYEEKKEGAEKYERLPRRTS